MHSPEISKSSETEVCPKCRNRVLSEIKMCPTRTEVVGRMKIETTICFDSTNVAVASKLAVAIKHLYSKESISAKIGYGIKKIFGPISCWARGYPT